MLMCLNYVRDHKPFGHEVRLKEADVQTPISSNQHHKEG